MKTAFNTIKPIFFALIGILLLFVTFKDLNWLQFLAEIKNANIEWALASVAFGYLAYVFRALRWSLLISPLRKDIKLLKLIHAIASGYLWNSFIPRSGELVRCTALNKVYDIPVSKLLGHVILERLIDLIILILLIIASIFMNYNQVLSLSQVFIISNKLIAILFIFTCLIFLAYYQRHLIYSHFESNRMFTKIVNFIAGLKQGFTSIKYIDNKFAFCIYTSLIWICYLLMTIVCFWCFEETLNLNLGQGLFILVAGGLGMLAPTPSGIGSYHYLVILALTSLGISQVTSQSFAFIVHFAQTIMVIIAGFIGMGSLYYSHGK